eukprot:3705942-Amphidinium_carterae.2
MRQAKRVEACHATCSTLGVTPPPNFVAVVRKLWLLPSNTRRRKSSTNLALKGMKTMTNTWTQT